MPDFTPDDISQFADDLQTITLRRPGRTTDQTSANALRRRVSIRDRAGTGGVYTTHDAVWHIPTADLAADPPRLGDIIIDADANEWTVIRMTEQAAATRWRLYARNLAITYNLDSWVNLERYTLSGTPAVKTWHPVAARVKARVQPKETKIYTDATTARLYKIYLVGDYDCDHTYRFVGPDATAYYPITALSQAPDVSTPTRGQAAVRHRKRIDRLQEITVTTTAPA